MRTPEHALHALVEVADASVIVVRGCYLALRRAVRIDLTARATGAVFVDEAGRSLGVRDVANVLGVPVLASVEPARVDGPRRRRRRAADAPSRCAGPARARAAGPHRVPRTKRKPREQPTSAAAVPGPLRDALHERLLAAPFDPATLGRAELRSRLAALLHDEAPLVTDAAAARVLDELVAEVDGLGPAATAARGSRRSARSW